jgi:hypothetical protein
VESQLTKKSADVFNSPALFLDESLRNIATKYYLNDPPQLETDLALYKTQQALLRDKTLKGATVKHAWCDLPKATANKARLFNQLMAKLIETNGKAYTLPWGAKVKVTEPNDKFFSFWGQFV